MTARSPRQQRRQVKRVRMWGVFSFRGRPMEAHENKFDAQHYARQVMGSYWPVTVSWLSPKPKRRKVMHVKAR